MKWWNPSECQKSVGFLYLGGVEENLFAEIGLNFNQNFKAVSYCFHVDFLGMTLFLTYV